MYINVQILSGCIKPTLTVLKDHIFHCNGAFTSLMYISILISVVQTIAAVINKIRLVHGITWLCMSSIYYTWPSL